MDQFISRVDKNKQIKVETVDSGGTVTGTIGEYFYDGDGKRVKKIAYDLYSQPTETTIFVYDASGKMVAEYSTALATTPQVSYLSNDHLGSPRINTDENGAVTARHDYQPFGEEIATSQRTTDLGYDSDEIRKKFTGYERDGETDLDFAQARMYSNKLGRFTTVDPINLTLERLVDPQRMNLFIYSRNDPMKFTDPTGEDVVLKDGMTKKQVDELVEELAKQYVSSEGVYNFLTNEEKLDTKLILNSGSMGKDDPGRIAYGRTSLDSKSGNITITLDFEKRDKQLGEYNIEQSKHIDNLVEPPTKSAMVKEEISHAIDARTDPKGYLKAVDEDGDFEVKTEEDRLNKPSEKRRLIEENKPVMSKATSTEKVKDLNDAKKQIREMIDYKNYKFAKKN